MSPLLDYNKAVEVAVDNKNAEDLRDLLVLSSELGARAMHEYISEGGACPAPRPAPWSSLPVLVSKRHLAGAAISAYNWVDAYSHTVDCLTEYMSNILVHDTSWSLPVLYGLCSDLRAVARQADEELLEEGHKAEKMDDVARVLLKAFQITNGDRTNEGSDLSKRVGTLECINQLFRVYFSLNNLRLCSNLTRTMSARGALDFEKSYPVAHRVTYKYYHGRLHLYEDRYEDAVECLQYAFDRTPARYEVNKRNILLYLIPARMLRGRLPSFATLTRYKMSWYEEIVKAVRTGHLSMFDKAVVKHEQFFIRKGLYLAMEKMRSLVYRSLCQKLHRVRSTAETERHKIRLREYQACLKLRGIQAGEDEVECVLANLIYNGLIKGYLSHKVKFLVLSTKQPFPSL